MILENCSSAIHNPTLTSPFGLIPVCSIYLSVYRAVVVPDGVYSIISIRKNRSCRSSSSALSPHQSLQLAKLLFQARVGGWQGLCDGGVPIGDVGFGARKEVRITFQRADIVAPKSCLLCEGNVASVKVERHGGVGIVWAIIQIT